MNMQTEDAGSDRLATIWRPLHAYVMAVVCLIIGVAIGYLVRGSEPPKNPAAAVAMPESVPTPAAASNTAAAPAATPSLDDMKRMAEKQAQPLLTELEKKPNDATLLNKTALTYKAAHQFDKAAEYFKKSLDSDPKNVAVRDDYASCLYYLGDVDGALAQLNKSLTYDPKHPGTLYNIGMIEWKGKGDTNAAVAAWEKMLKLNPNLPQKDQIQHMIEMVKQSKPQVADKQ
jgi:tetratricopeptide (TPR) repeat protein